MSGLPPMGLTVGFAEFWTCYPRRVAKVDAEKAYRQALKRGATHAQIMASLEFMLATEWKGCDPKFIPYAGTFFQLPKPQGNEVSKGV